MTKQEIEIVKKFLKEVLCQLDAEVTDYGTTTTTPKTDRTETCPPETETTCTTSKVYLTEEGYTTFKVSTYGRNRGYIASLLLTVFQRVGEIAVNNQDKLESKMHYYDGLLDMTMEQLDIIFKGE